VSGAVHDRVADEAPPDRRPSAGDVDYEMAGAGYACQRRPDPRIGALVDDALGRAALVLNVGAGAGSYEPTDRRCVALEPSSSMLGQRPPGSAPVVRGVAGALPFADATFDAAMAVVTVHQWPDAEAGLREIRRVTVGPVVVLTFDPDALDRLWLMDLAPELLAAEAARYPSIAQLTEWLGTGTTVEPVPIAADCVDGFTEAYFNRPEAFLDPVVRRSQSAWTFLEPGVESAIVGRLADALESGAWDMAYGAARFADEYDGAVRLLVAPPP
jgi:SAM-dependent methyltransferase